MKQITRQMVEKELEKYAEDFLQKNYGLDLKVPIKINGRFTTTLGRFRRAKKGKKIFAYDIDISKKLIEYNQREDIEDVLRHELIHYALFELGFPHNDGDEYFENELKVHNTSSTGTGRHIKMTAYVYECGCDEIHQEKKDGHNYRCSACKEGFKFKKKIEPKKMIKIV